MLGLTGVAAAIAVAALVGAGALAPRADLDPDSPAGVVQRYLAAVADRDVDGVVATLHPDLLRECDRGDLRRAVRDDVEDFRASLRGTEDLGDEVAVTVEISRHDGEPPFDAGGYEHQTEFLLERHEGAWRIVEAPWPFHLCPRWQR